MTSWIRREKGWLKRYAPPPAAPDQRETDEGQAVATLTPPVVYGVIYHPLKCPRCQSKDITTYSSRPPTRYHRCKPCGCRFRSTEVD